MSCLLAPFSFCFSSGLGTDSKTKIKKVILNKLGVILFEKKSPSDVKEERNLRGTEMKINSETFPTRIEKDLNIPKDVLVKYERN